MALKGNKYFSRFSGEDLDRAVDYILKLRSECELNIIGSTIDDKIDLDTVKDEGIYVIHYYINSYDDTLSPTKIEMHVFNISSDVLCQRYDVRGETVQRYYDITGDVWSDWAPVKNILSVEQDEVVSVGKPTLVFRHYNGNASEDYTP